MDNPLGGITLEEIEAESKNQPFPENAGATAGERFILKISALVTIRQDQGESGGVAVFLQSDALASDAEGVTAIFNPLLATGNDQITDRVWLSNAALGGAYALEMDCREQAQLFMQIRQAGFGRLPALVLDWRGAVPAGRFFSRGVDDLEQVQEVILAYTEITQEDLKTCLDHFHATSLKTPQRVREAHSEAIWKDTVKGWPESRPEERIQGKLVHHLRSRYTKHVVRAERKNDDGIVDLLIFSHTKNVANQKVIVSEWVLELKALADKSSTGGAVGPSVVKVAIEKGLTQAIAYRQQEHARKAALCCFDMRSSDEGDQLCFSDILDEAREQDVILWRWFIHRSSEKSRVADRKERRSVKHAGT